MVFCIDPVGTVTAWMMNVIPKSANTSVTVNDSKYSRNVDFGGPVGFASSGCSFLFLLFLFLFSCHNCVDQNMSLLC
jgi:hypothetical protein